MTQLPLQPQKLGRGVRVIVNDPKQPRWHGEPGFIVAAHPPIGEPHSFVVRVAGREVIFPVGRLEIAEGAA